MEIVVVGLVILRDNPFETDALKGWNKHRVRAFERNAHDVEAVGICGAFVRLFISRHELRT